MHVIETFSEGPKPYNEDIIIQTPDFVGITDGSSSSHHVRGEPGGLVLARAIAAAMVDVPAQATFRECLDLLTDVAAEILTVDGQLVAAAATLTLYSRTRREMWMLGNGHVTMDGWPYTNKPPHMTLLTKWRCAILRGRIAAGASVDSLRSLRPDAQPFRDWLAVEPLLVNHPTDPYGVGAINGTAVPERYLRFFPVTGTIKRVTIASDGFVSAPQSLKAGLNELERVCRDDPLMIYQVEGDRAFQPGQRLFDDTSFVAFRV